jgi:hypothetical protein
MGNESFGESKPRGKGSNLSKVEKVDVYMEYC